MKQPRLIIAVMTAGAMIWANAAAAAPRLAANTFRSAYAFNTSHQVGKRWTVSVIEEIRNANRICKRTDPAIYTKPKKGYQYVVVDFRMKKLTGGPVELMTQDVSYQLVTKGGKHKYGTQPGIVAPNDASETPAVGQGQSITGTYTFQVRKTDVPKVRVLARDSREHAVNYFKL